MKPLRVYVDTSVIGGCGDKEFAEDSLRLVREAKRGRIQVLISEVVVTELAGAPSDVRAVLEGLDPDAIELVPLSSEVIALREAYLEAEVVSESSRNDATHVAAATVARADAIVSWNFKHIVKLEKIKAYNQVNLLNGYGILTILTPRDACGGEASET